MVVRVGQLFYYRSIAMADIESKGGHQPQWAEEGPRLGG